MTDRKEWPEFESHPARQIDSHSPYVALNMDEYAEARAAVNMQAEVRELMRVCGAVPTQSMYGDILKALAALKGKMR